MGDTGPQTTSTSYVGEGGLGTQAIDLEAAVGRKHEEEDEAGDKHSDDGDSSAGLKREAEPGLESEPVKKMKEGEADQEKAGTETTNAEGDQMETE